MERIRLDISHLPSLRCALAATSAAALTGAILCATAFLGRNGLRDSEDQLLVCGIVAVFAIVTGWLVFKSGRRSRKLAAAQATLAANEATRIDLEQMLLGMPVAGFRGRLMPDGTVKRLFLTSGIERLTGWTSDEIPDHATFIGLVHFQDRLLAEGHSGQVLRGGEATSEYRLRRGNGDYGWFRQSSRLEVLANGDTDFIGSLSDVTATHVLSEQAALNEKRFRGLLEVSPDAVIIADEAGIIVFASPRVEFLFGHKPADLIGRSRELLIPEQHRAAYATRARDYFAAPRGPHSTIAIPVAGLRSDGGEFPAEVSLSRYHTPDGLFVLAGVRDITHRLEAVEQHRRVQKMEGICQVTGGIAHDFNNLLTTILGNAELLEWSDNAFDDETNGLISAIQTAGQRAAQLARQLLACTRQQMQAPAVCDINLLLRGMLDTLGETAGDRIAVDLVLAGALWLTDVDANQLENAILNCAINARDAMVEGGILRIETANTQPGDASVQLDTGPRGEQNVRITISDTGTGMNLETLQKAFDPFYTTKPESPGIGLGLSQVHGFVKQSGGRVTLVSELGVGSSVRISLPRHRAETDSLAEATEHAEFEHAYATETVLVMEEDAMARELSAAALTRLGYRVLTAESADAALKILEQEPETELLFTDIGLPGMDRRQLAEDARRRCPDLEILFTAGKSPDGIDDDKALSPGVNSLLKPYTIHDLAWRVRDILDQRNVIA